jgi:lipopolysaccharide transport protein LptA
VSPLFLMWMACLGHADLPLVEGEPRMEGVVVVINAADEPVTLTLASAVVDEEGNGQGEASKATVPGPPPLVITGKHSSWRLNDGLLVFEGDVVAERGDVTLRCDRLEVTYADDKVQQALAIGSVRVIRGDRVASADRGRLTVADGRIRMEGNPSLAEGPNVMTGTEIVLFLDDDTLECQQCRLQVEGGAVLPDGSR